MYLGTLREGGMEGHLPKGPARPQAVVWRLPRRRHVTDLIRWPFGLCSGMIGFSQPANDMALLQVHIAVAMLAQVAIQFLKTRPPTPKVTN